MSGIGAFGPPSTAASTATFGASDRSEGSQEMAGAVRIAAPAVPTSGAAPAEQGSPRPKGPSRPRSTTPTYEIVPAAARERTISQNLTSSSGSGHDGTPLVPYGKVTSSKSPSRVSPLPALPDLPPPAAVPAAAAVSSRACSKQISGPNSGEGEGAKASERGRTPSGSGGGNPARTGGGRSPGRAGSGQDGGNPVRAGPGGPYGSVPGSGSDGGNPVRTGPVLAQGQVDNGLTAGSGSDGGNPVRTEPAAGPGDAVMGTGRDGGNPVQAVPEAASSTLGNLVTWESTRGPDQGAAMEAASVPVKRALVVREASPKRVAAVRDQDAMSLFSSNGPPGLSNPSPAGSEAKQKHQQQQYGAQQT